MYSAKGMVRGFVEDTIVNRNDILSKATAVLSYRPFNMKGQELEEVIGSLLQDYLDISEPEANYNVKVPQDKKAADIIISNNEEESSFDIKFYGGATRLQLSTLKSILQDIRDYFQNTEEGSLNDEDKSWLIELVSSIETDYNLSFFVSQEKQSDLIDVCCFDFERFRLDIIQNMNFELRRVGTEKRIQIHILFAGKIYLEISAGGNPLNRGMWINNVKSSKDLQLVFDTGFIDKVFSRDVIVKNFDSSAFVLEKASNTLGIINTYFEDTRD